MIFHNLMMKRPKKLNFKFRPRDNKKIKALVVKCKPSLIDSEYKYLSCNCFETSTFYGCAKIHKLESLHKQSTNKRARREDWVVF